jgi:hypothetical protein
MTPVFQHVTTLLSFVLALSVSHQLFTVVDSVRAWHRVKHPWVHSVWMANCFLSVISWWIGFWDLRHISQWPVIIILSLLAGAIGLFLAVAFVCPRVPQAGNIDLWQFHLDNRRKYLTPLLFSMVVGTMATLYYGDVQNVPNQNVQAVIFVFMIFAVLAAYAWANAAVQRLAAAVYFAGSVVFFVLGVPVLTSN